MDFVTHFLRESVPPKSTKNLENEKDVLSKSDRVSVSMVTRVITRTNRAECNMMEP